MNRSRHSLPREILSAALLASLTACAGEAAPQGSSSPDRYRVQRGTMQIQVTTGAEVKPGKETIIRSEVEGQNTVIYLVGEGKEVKGGDKLVELDSSQLVERRAKQEIDFARAEALRTQSEKDYEIQDKQCEADLSDAANKLKIAALELEKFLGRPKDDYTREMGEKEQKTVAAEADIKLAKGKFEVAKDKFNWSEKLAHKGFITKNELERDRLDKESAETAVMLCENKKDLLILYEHAKTEIDLQQKLDIAKLELARVGAKNEAKMAQMLAEKKSRLAEYELAKERLENLRKQVEHCLILSPGPGIVVYSQLDSRGMSREFISEGATVRERQGLLLLPDTTRMICALKIHESDIEKVKKDMPARISVGSINTHFDGFVRRVAPLPDSGQRFNNPDLKVFQAEVEIDMDSPGLKPGTSADVSILVAEIKDTLKVPIQSVQRDRLVQYVWVDEPNGPRAVQVELGLSDRNFVQVKSGLEEGAIILMATPATETPPKFQQPAVTSGGPASRPRRGADGAASEAADLRAGSRPSDATGGDPQRRGRGGNQAGGGGNPQRMALTNELIEAIKTKHPELAAKFEGEGMARFMALNDEEVKKAIEEDPDLKAKSAALAAMRGRRGQGGPGGQGPGQRGEGRQVPPGEGEAGRDGK